MIPLKRVLFALAALVGGGVHASEAQVNILIQQASDQALSGRHEHGLRIVEMALLRFPEYPTLLATRDRIRQAAALERGKPEPARPSTRRLPAIANRTAEPGRDFTTVTGGIALLWVKPGTVVLRDPFGSDDDTTVTLTRGYWLGRTEVTQEQLQAVMEHLPPQSYFRGSDRPAERITWLSAMEFAAKLNERERAAGRVPAGYEYTLPTEAQWEYACRAGTTGLFAGELTELAWFAANSDGQTHPVGQKQPNAWGFYDMHGNVMEWCLDGYHSYPGGHVMDLLIGYDGPSAAMARRVRGGAWVSSIGQCRAAARYKYLINYAGPAVGFRLALAPVRTAPNPTADAATPP